MGQTRLFLSLLAAWTTWAVFPVAGLAQETNEPDEETRQATQQQAGVVAQGYVKLGEELFRQGHYGEAVENFRRAEDTLAKVEAEVPALLYRSMARCYDQLGQIPAALSYYKKFLALSEPSSDSLERAIREARDAAARLRLLLDRTAIQFEVQPAGTEVRVDQRVVGSTPLQPLPVAPGPHQVSLSAPGFRSLSLPLQLEAGAVVPVVVTLERDPAAPVSPPLPASGGAEDPRATPTGGSGPPASSSPDRSRLRPLLLGGLGAVALGSAIGAGLLFQDAADREQAGDDLVDQLFSTAAEAEQARQAANGKYDEAANRRTWGWILVGAGVLAVGGGVWVTLTGREQPTGEASAEKPAPERQRWTVLPWVAGNVGGVLVQGRY